jgi:hypothetical protein
MAHTCLIGCSYNPNEIRAVVSFTHEESGAQVRSLESHSVCKWWDKDSNSKGLVQGTSVDLGQTGLPDSQETALATDL